MWQALAGLGAGLVQGGIGLIAQNQQNKELARQQRAAREQAERQFKWGQAIDANAMQNQNIQQAQQTGQNALATQFALQDRARQQNPYAGMTPLSIGIGGRR